MKTTAMNKRGSEIAINPLIVIALGVIVLVILIVIFRDQINKGGDSYTDLSNQATLDDTVCSFVKGRSCQVAPCTPPNEQITQASSNCPKKKTVANGKTTETPQICCGKL